MTFPASERLFSLDVLRGLDMMLLTVVGPLVCAAQKGWNCFPDWFMRQFNHGWECFTLWDIIMPLFIFMCGAAMPLALERRLKKGGGARAVACGGSVGAWRTRPGPLDDA